MLPYPWWLHVLSLAYLSVCFLSAAIIIIDELCRAQKMGIIRKDGQSFMSSETAP
jgi:hypothetical protein